MVGPTGVGKTDVSVQIANKYFEIISADSVQVYKYLDVGSSKPDEKTLKKVKHHLIDIVEPDFHFTAGHFCDLAVRECSNISDQGKFPLFVGGTAFYIDSFFNGLAEIPKIDDSIKKQLNLELNKDGLHFLFQELKKCDEKFSSKIHSNDKQRILRGLEVYRGTGKPLSSYFNSKTGYGSEDTLYIGLYSDRQLLRERIDQRVDNMIKSGFLDEVVRLREMGYGPELRSMQSIGYLELNKYLDGEFTFEAAVEKIRTDTKKYAKRQMTWLRRNKKIHWINPEDISNIAEMVSKFLDKFV